MPPAAKKNKIGFTLQPLVGDWITYKPKVRPAQSPRTPFKPKVSLSEQDLITVNQMLLNTAEKFLAAVQRDFELPCTVNSVSFEVLNYVDILKDLTMPLVQFKISASGYEEYLCLDMNLSAALISSAVGAGIEIVPIKGLTEIEEEVLETAVKGTAQRLSLTQGDAEVRFLNFPKLYFEQAILSNQSFALAEIEVGFGKDTSARMYRVIPSGAVLGLLESKERSRRPVKVEKLPPAITNKVFADITAELGTTLISAKELYDLQPGDVLVLDNTLNNLVMVNIGKHLQLFGQPGIKENRLSLQLTSKPSGKVEKIKSSPVSFETFLQEQPAVTESPDTGAEFSESAGTEEMPDMTDLVSEEGQNA